jgi:hypothetical protein
VGFLAILFLFCPWAKRVVCFSIHSENPETLRRIYFSRAAHKREERALGSSENPGESALEANRGFFSTVQIDFYLPWWCELVQEGMMARLVEQILQNLKHLCYHRNL